MSAPYAKRFEAVFLCTHSKEPKMSYKTATKYMHKSEDFVRKWVTRYKIMSMIFPREEKHEKRRKKTIKSFSRYFSESLC